MTDAPACTGVALLLLSPSPFVTCGRFPVVQNIFMLPICGHALAIATSTCKVALMKKDPEPVLHSSEQLCRCLPLMTACLGQPFGQAAYTIHVDMLHVRTLNRQELHLALLQSPKL